jgi:uncharacterized membrane protein
VTGLKAKRLVQTGLLAAVIAVTTMVVNVPLPGVKGYVNVGDAVVLLSGILLGPAAGAFAGAVGSSLADLLLGYAHWAPWTFIIKGIEGFLAGWLAFRPQKGSTFLGVFAGAGVMVVGYLLVGMLYYGWAAAVVSLPGDLLQGGVSALLCVIIANPLRKYLKLGD